MSTPPSVKSEGRKSTLREEGQPRTVWQHLQEFLHLYYSKHAFTGQEQVFAWSDEDDVITAFFGQNIIL